MNTKLPITIVGVISIIGIVIYRIGQLLGISIHVHLTYPLAQTPWRKTPSRMHPNQICQGGEAALPYSEHLLYHPGSETS